jgi:cysteine-rich repeat protein
VRARIGEKSAPNRSFSPGDSSRRGGQKSSSARLLQTGSERSIHALHMTTEVRLSFVALLALNASFLACSGTTPPERGVPNGGNGNSGGTSSGGFPNGGSGAIPVIPPVNIADCGNGSLNGSEQCDDSNVTPGDGCSAGCQIEADYLCDVPGQPCVSNAVCGNGSLSSAEACDDGNAEDGDGCNATCSMVDPGWQCRVRCAATAFSPVRRTATTRMQWAATAAR